jgi:hypothetical protein
MPTCGHQPHGVPFNYHVPELDQPHERGADRGLRLAQGIADRKSTMPMLANVLLRTQGFAGSASTTARAASMIKASPNGCGCRAEARPT